MAITVFDVINGASTLFWLAIAVVAVIAIYYLVQWLRKLYSDFTDPNATIEEQITNMFTPHTSDGTVAPKDIAPKGTDPVDWLFMDHSLSEAI
jgi:hypothetical protein